MEAYRRMAQEAQYRPAAPSDGMGNITVPFAELEVGIEAREYANRWWQAEDAGDYVIGYPSFERRPALIFTVEAARVICGSTDETGIATAARLLRMAATELEQRA